MSASPHSFVKLPRSPDVLDELLHSLSQPLTSLRCSLELSLAHSLRHSLELSVEEVAAQRQESVAVALQQTEKVIGMIRLMREYVDAEQPGPKAFSAALEPTMRSVVEELSSIAAVRGVRLLLAGTCRATLRVAESRLRLALQYLIAPLIEAQPAGGKVMLLLGEGPAGAVLRVEGERGFRVLSEAPSTLRRVRLAIASRVLENAGASLVLSDVGPAGFVLRVPRPVDAPA
ncbi:MAG: hypothetical protein WCA13_16550 [Terriglobales bacterium]